MADNSDNRKKALIISVFVFLFIGGGVSLFFITQGSNDLTGAGVKNSFSYGFSVRDAVLPLFKRLGMSTYEDELVDLTKKRLEARGIDLSPAKPAPADVSDWMAGDSAGTGASKAPAPASRTGAAVIPRMSGGGLPAGGSGGGGTKSARDISRFGTGAAAGNATVSAKSQAVAGGPSGKSTFGTLKNARAVLGEGLRSGSAMTASSKWGQSFGLGGSGGGKPAEMAYANPGLVKLDQIKSGEIPDLKMDDDGSLKATPVSPPAISPEDAAKKLEQSQKILENKMKADLANAMMQSLAQSFNNNQMTQRTQQKPKPPDSVTKLGNNSNPPDGKYCPSGCSMSGGGSYTDNTPDYKQEGGVWTVTYTGKQTMPDGSVVPYADRMAIVPGGTPPMQPLESFSNGKQIEFGGI